MMAYSCVNKHGMFAAGQPFGRNVTNGSECRRLTHSDSSGGAHSYREVPVILSTILRRAFRSKRNEAGG